MSATEVPEIVKLVIYMELLAKSSMCEVGSGHKVCFGAFKRPTKGIGISVFRWARVLILGSNWGRIQFPIHNRDKQG